MTPVLVDSNVILDVATRDLVWGEWSKAALDRMGSQTLLIINPVIFAEVSVGFQRIEDVAQVLPRNTFIRESVTYEVGFLAGKAFKAYRTQGGIRLSPLPDFFIGAHAQIAGYRLLTRDTNRYRSYFPTVELIAPEQ